MEDTLRGVILAYAAFFSNVLILILMEDTLRAICALLVYAQHYQS